VHEWAAANGLKLNPIKSQVKVISRGRVDIPPRMLLMGSDVIKVVPKVNNLTPKKINMLRGSFTGILKGLLNIFEIAPKSKMAIKSFV
jgi:hypothetical protein